ncbi:MAG TPA: hypothetical protein VE053_08290 [Allosphingosinicella sp.]|nr:hypothetical protein [Allosphingosinicella sp.]
MPIRVMLGEMTPMVGSALRGSLGECDDIELVGAPGGQAAYEGVDVLVLHQSPASACGTMLKALVAAAPIGVVAIDGNGESGSLYRLDREAWRFVPGGGHGLAEAIRAAAGTG